MRAGSSDAGCFGSRNPSRGAPQEVQWRFHTLFRVLTCDCGRRERQPGGDEEPHSRVRRHWTNSSLLARARRALPGSGSTPLFFCWLRRQAHNQNKPPASTTCLVGGAEDQAWMPVGVVDGRALIGATERNLNPTKTGIASFSAQRRYQFPSIVALQQLWAWE